MTLKIVRKSRSHNDEEGPFAMAFWDAKAGAVREVNLSGVFIEYVGLKGKGYVGASGDDGLKSLANIKLVNGKNCITMQAVPVAEVSDREIGPYAGCAFLRNRLCRISFGRLSPVQAGLLSSFLSGFIP